MALPKALAILAATSLLLYSVDGHGVEASTDVEEPGSFVASRPSSPTYASPRTWRPLQEPEPKRWYGYQLVLGDVASLLLLFSGANNEALVKAGTVSLFLTPSVIHMANRRGTLAIISPVMRVTFAFVGALIGSSLESCGEDSFLCGLRGFALGAMAGFTTAMIVDWCLAWKPVIGASTDETAAVRRRHPLVTLHSAGIAPQPNGASLVLGGRF